MENLSNLAAGFRDLLKFENWAQLVTSRLLFRRQTLVVYRYRGLEILVDYGGGDQHGTRACLATDMYSRYFHHLPKELPLNVLDLGANGGGLPLSLCAHGFKFGSLACVEMNPATFARLQFNITRNISCSARHLLNAAAYHSDGVISVNLGRGGTNDSLHTGSTGKQSITQEIQTRSFDSIADECFSGAPIDLCKMDIEAAEFDVILSKTAKRLGDVRLLLIEIHPHPLKKTDELLSALAGLGFAELSREQDTGLGCTVHLLENKRMSQAAGLSPAAAS